MKTGAHLTHRVGMWDDAGNEIIEHPLRLRSPTRQATALETRFKPPAHLAVRLPKSHTMLSQAGSDREHDAVATVLIIGASRGIGLETVKAALEAGHSVRALARSARRIPIDQLDVSVGPEIILKPTRLSPKRRECSSPRWRRLKSGG
jgi:short chain dehydrogenase